MLEHLPAEQREAALAQIQSMLAKAGAMASAVGKPGLAAKLSQPPAAEPGSPPRPPHPPLDIDKAWHGVHAVLCGVPDEAPPPLGQVVLGGEPLGDDLGYGPCRFLTPEQVRATAAAVAKVSAGEFRRRYDPAALNAAQVYPGHWEDPDNLEWLADAFEDVRRYFDQASASGEAMLLYLT
jgi:hypothetical protein